MSRLAVTTPPANRAERAYALDVMLGHWLGFDLDLTVDPAATVTTITVPGHQGQVTLADGILAGPLDQAHHQRALDPSQGDGGVPLGEGLVPVDLAGTPLADRFAPGAGHHLPVVWGPEPPTVATVIPAGSATADQGPAVELAIDVTGTVFALLSGLEDRVVTERDPHDRVPRSASLLGRRGLEERPVVDETVAVVEAALVTVWPGLSRPQPELTVHLTQDVDRLTRHGSASARHLALSAASGARRGQPDPVRGLVSAAVEGWQVRRQGPQCDPYFTFDAFMDLAEGHGHTASFYFIARYQPSDGTPLSRYDLSGPDAQWLLARIGERGHQIGIHPGYDSHRDPVAITADVEALRQAARTAGVELGPVGGRHHYLRWDTHHTPGCWQAAGLAHDSSLGWPDGIGFRCGTTRRFPLWDHQAGQATGVIERPLVWMDVALGAMGLAYGDGGVVDRLARLRQTCARHGGEYTMLVHNDQLAEPGLAELVDQLLA